MRKNIGIVIVALFTDDEFHEMNDFQTFTTAVILFENNDMIRNYMRNIYNTIKHFHMKHRKPLPAFDQPITNKLCIDHDIYDNIEMTKYCMNIGHSDKQEEILKINNYLLCHFFCRNQCR